MISWIVHLRSGLLIWREAVLKGADTLSKIKHFGIDLSATSWAWPLQTLIFFPLKFLSAGLDSASAFSFQRCFFFFIHVFQEDKIYCSQLAELFMYYSSTVYARLMGPIVTLFRKKIKIKNGFHGTIHTFKNYFATVFSVFSF